MGDAKYPRWAWVRNASGVRFDPPPRSSVSPHGGPHVVRGMGLARARRCVGSWVAEAKANGGRPAGAGTSIRVDRAAHIVRP